LLGQRSRHEQRVLQREASEVNQISESLTRGAARQEHEKKIRGKRIGKYEVSGSFRLRRTVGGFSGRSRAVSV